jgi:small conductance mechanosensitive channel
LDNEERILTEPKPQIAVSELAESSVNFIVRPWVNSPDYLPVMYSLLENIKKSFDKEGISIPYPQSDVHIHEKKA